MFDMSDDMIQIRAVEKMAFIFSIFALIFFDLLWVAAIYIFVGFSIAFSDDSVDDMHENDIDNWYLHNIDLSTAAEREGFVLNDHDIMDLLHTANEDPVLPLSYRMVDGYIKLFLENHQNLHQVKTYDYTTGSYQPRLNYETVQNFTKYKITLKREFEQEFFKAQFSKRYDLLKFKSVGLILNEYLSTSIFTQGLYPVNDYDLFLFKAHNVPQAIQYPYYTFLFPSKKDIYNFEMNNYDQTSISVDLNLLENLNQSDVIRVKNKRVKYLKSQKKYASISPLT